MEIKALQNKLHPVLARRTEVRLGYLFGSAAQGHANALSDLDIALLVDEAYSKTHATSFDYELSLISDLTEALHTDKIDLVLLNQAPPLLAHEVIRTGSLLFCRDEQERMAFELLVKKRYLDTKALRDLKRQYLYRRIERGCFSEVKLPLSTEK